MKTFHHLLLTCLALAGLALTGCSSGPSPRSIRVLYLSGQSDWQNGEISGSLKVFATDEEFQESVDDRANAWAALLRTYFDSVTVMSAADWRPELSAGYDVTVFDGLTPVIEESRTERDANGRVLEHIPARYLPDDFAGAAITIGSLGNTLLRRNGIKNDWYCLCLDAQAHSMDLGHPIFNQPFPTAITQTLQPTPEDALHYAYFQDWAVPDSVMMWAVNTQGYMTTEGFNAGMVSRPWGYCDSPDCEVMSSGVCAKTIDAVAIGRHANFLHWGFAGSPLYMTEEAKVVFANAVVYIARFGGQTAIARKHNDRIATRDYLKELKWCVSREYYAQRLETDSLFYANLQEAYASALSKVARGQADSLTASEQYVYQAGGVQVPPRKTYAEYLKQFLSRRGDNLFERFGTDEAAYIAYFNDNEPYLYGGKGMYQMTLDDDCKAWGIANNDIRLLDKAISCLERGEETERAWRVLDRYTLCEFTEPAQWRTWYKKYRSKLFFTESGGWYFLVNDAGAPGNDYSAPTRRQAARLAAEAARADKAAETAAQAGQGAGGAGSSAARPGAVATGGQLVGDPDPQNPVLVSASLQRKDGDQAELRVRLRIFPGFHVYHTVADSDPYSPLKVDVALPEGGQAAKATFPVAVAFGSKGTTVYEDEAEVVQPLTLPTGPQTVVVKVSGQACDSQVCMPPFEEEISLSLQ